MRPKVAIQYIAYWSPEAAKDIDACMTSLLTLRYDKDRVRLIVVDNPSPHGSARTQFEEKWIGHDQLPEIVFLDSPVNDGFAGGHNRAWEASCAWGAEYVYLLNQDALVDQDFLQEIVTYAQNHPNTPIVQSLIVSEQDRSQVDSYGNAMHYLGFGYQDPDGHRSHFYATGAGLLIRTDHVSKIGGLFDTDYFMYHDDVDLSWRARLAGYSIGTAMASKIYHRYEFSRSIGKFYWMERNRFLTHFTHLKWRTLLLIWPMMKVMELGTLVYALRSGWFTTKLKVYVHFFKPSTWSYIRARRRLIRSIRRVDDRELLQVMVPTIEAQEVANVLLDKIANPLMRTYYRFLLWAVRW